MGAAVVSAIAGIALVQHQQGLANPGITQPFILTPEASHFNTLHYSPNQLPTHLGFPVMMSHHYHCHLRVEGTVSPGVTCSGGVGSGLE